MIDAQQAAPQQEAQEPAARYTIEDVRKARSEGYRNGIESSVPSKITEEMRHAFREKYKESSIWTDRLAIALEGMLAVAPQPAPAPLSDDVVKDAARFRDLYRMTALLGTPAGNAYQDAMESEMVIALKEAGSDLTKISIEQYRRVIDAGFAAATLAAQGGKV